MVFKTIAIDHSATSPECWQDSTNMSITCKYPYMQSLPTNKRVWNWVPHFLTQIISMRLFYQSQFSWFQRYYHQPNPVENLIGSKLHLFIRFGVLPKYMASLHRSPVPNYWLFYQDSNLNKQNQNLLCYHYTIEQYNKCVVNM